MRDGSVGAPCMSHEMRADGFNSVFEEAKQRTGLQRNVSVLWVRVQQHRMQRVGLFVACRRVYAVRLRGAL
jgi:hypothetical protein